MILREQTEQLLQECETCKNRFFQMREKDVTPDFFQDVKPYADSIQLQLLEWKENAILWIQEYKPKYLHEQQIESVVENMNQFVVHRKSLPKIVVYVSSGLMVVRSELKKAVYPGFITCSETTLSIIHELITLFIIA